MTRQERAQMSEPTNGGNQQPDPDPDKNTEGDPEEVPDQVQDSVSHDPTEALWADPTAPIPAAPTPPGPSDPQSDLQAESPQVTPPAPPPLSNPYAQLQPVAPYGQPPVAPYGQQQAGPPYPAYGQQQAGPPYPAYSQQAYRTGPTQANGSAIVLTVVSGVSLLFCNILAIASLVLGIVALTRNTTDHEGSRRLTKVGWIVFAAVWAVAILGVIAYVVFVAIVMRNGSSSNNMFGN
jgi:hypothetical protein